MKTRRFVVAATAALVVLSLGASAFAANQTRSGTRTQIKSGTCTK